MEKLKLSLIGIITALILPLTAGQSIGHSAYAGGICRSVTRGSYNHVATGYRAKRVFKHHGHGYGHAYSTFVAVDPYYHVDLVAGDIKAAKALQRGSQTADDVLKLQGQVELLAKMVAAQRASGGVSGDGELLSTAEPENELDSEVLPILRTHCAKCHSGSGSRGGFQLFEEDKSTPIAWGPKEKFLTESVVNDNSMPPSGAKLSAEEYQAVRKWMEDDREAIRALLLK